MSWPYRRYGSTDPDNYPEIPEQAARELRADFEHQHNLREIAPFGETPEQTAQFEQEAERIEALWGQHDNQRLRQLWAGLKSVADLLDTHPVLARDIADRMVRAEAVADTSGEADRDHRTAVEQTLGMPRAGAALLNRTQVDELIAATGEVLAVHELLTRATQRAMLLPPGLREIPAVDESNSSEMWRGLRVVLARQLHALAATHEQVAAEFGTEPLAAEVGGDRGADEDRIDRLAQLQDALRVARADALGAGIPSEVADRVYRAGRDQAWELTSARDAQQLAPYLGADPGHPNSRSATAPTLDPGPTAGGAVIEESVGAALTGGHTDWSTNPVQHDHQPASADLTTEVEQ